jgi:hypothetical protein
MEVLQMIQDCTFEDRTYPPGSEICSFLRCMICEKGQWEDLDSNEFAALVGQPFCRSIRPI